MIKLKEVVVVEGRYDKNTLSQILEATIIETHGFGIFSDKELLSMLRRLAETRGLVVMTDSDGAGFMIRNHLKGAIDPQYVKHAYIPDIPGKEKTVGNVQECRARQAPVVGVATKGDDDAAAQVDDVIFVPRTIPEISPIVSVVALQLFAYHVARLRGCEIDQPRNLAKSVTVE